MASKANVMLAKTCHRYYESCLWNSTILFLMLSRLRTVKSWVTIVPILIGASPGLTTVIKLAYSQNVTKLDILLSITSFFSGMTPLIYNALKLDDQIENLRSLSAEYTNLRDRFRTAAEVSIHKTTKEFEADVCPLIERLEKAREVGVTTPDWAYKKAEAKIKAGHYEFEVDQVTIDTQMTVQLDTENLPSQGSDTPREAGGPAETGSTSS